MLTRILMAIGCCALLAGCGRQQETSTAPETNSSSAITAPVDYLGAIHQGQQHAVKTLDTASLTQAIQLFQVEHGRFPRDLNELVQEKLIARIPEPPAGMRISYDPQTGQIRIVKQ